MQKKQFKNIQLLGVMQPEDSMFIRRNQKYRVKQAELE